SELLPPTSPTSPLGIGNGHWVVAPSAAKQAWQRQKELYGDSNPTIDAIMEMTGLEDVKSQVLKIKNKIDTTSRQSAKLSEERLNVCMLGNPGTGKTTIARLYGKFLASVNAVPGSEFVETTGSRLANDGVPGIKSQIEDLLDGDGGVLFVDEAYQLTNGSNFQGTAVLDYILAEMEKLVGKIVFIFAGYRDEMEKLFEHNPGLQSRIPYTFRFNNYSDAELLEMLSGLVEKKWGGRMQVEADSHGIRGLLGRIAVRRLGRQRVSKNFGNARALATMFSKITERQADRLSKARREERSEDDFLLTQEDIMGPEPAKVLEASRAWKRLKSLIGLDAVKRTVQDLFTMVQANYQRELKEKTPYQVSLNRVFLGSPGTGKTTVAKLYGQILAELGLLSNGDVVTKNPSDFIGGALGQSESQMKSILASTVGKVLVIDEAYMLGNSGSSNGSDSYKTAVIDTIVAEVQSVPGEDHCVLLLGYKDQMEEMFQSVNPGLSRRFAIEHVFVFEDYTDAQLMQALEWKLRDQDLSATDKAKTVAIETLSRLRNRPNFGNIGEVENVLSQAKLRLQSRQMALPAERRSHDAPFQPEDFDPAFARVESASANLAKLFEDVVGCEDIIQKLAAWQVTAKRLKARGKDPRDHVPTNFIFKGPPGTGKTTTARKMGKVYYDMGFLSSAEVMECSVSDLVGQYVGHTVQKTRRVFEKALGKVLLVDEAYRLSEGQYAKEAVDEIVGILTQERFRGKLIVIFAGYEQEMNNLLTVNSGLASRFSEEIVFRHLSPENCLKILTRNLRNQDIQLAGPSDQRRREMISILEGLQRLPSWGNARDMETLLKRLTIFVLSSLDST
ncbi:P-loop containing nucleoside triphosphate hydrolase protein, partial [Gloeophyllum trabeum ATCC 11539]